MSDQMIHMTCEKFAEIIHDLDRTGTAGHELREDALTHAESCSRCAQLLTETEALDFGLQVLASHETHRQAPPRVEAALMQAFRREKQAVAREKIWWRVAALATAASILLTCGILLREHMTTGAPAGITVQNISSPVQGTSDGWDGSAIGIANDIGSSAMEYAGFVSLPYADDAASIEQGAMVRVSLSRSALASLGVPVADATDTNEIPADLIVSMDGTPQAIRLVSETTAN